MRNLVAAFCLLGLSACAGTDTEPRNQHRYPTAQEAANRIGCSDDQVAICIEINCELEDYSCSNRDDVRSMFKADEFQH